MSLLLVRAVRETATLLGLAAMLFVACVWVAPAQDPAAVGSIRGRVVAKDSGAPVPQGWVIATPVRMSTTLHRSYGGRIQNDGSFAIHNIEFGSYLLTAKAPQHRNSDESGEVQDKRVVEVYAGGQRVKAGGSEVLLRLERTGVISGTVRDEDGFPVDRGHVWAFAVSKDGKRTRRHNGGWNTTTDDQGRFRLGGLWPGTYFVKVQRQDAYQMANVEDRSSPDAAFSLGARVNSAYHPGVVGPEQAMVVQVGAGEERYGVDIVFPPELGYPISGIVVRPDGAPTMGAYVSIIRGSDRFPFATESTHARVDQDGTFQSSPLPPGEYTLTVSLPSQDRRSEGLFGQAAVSLGGGPADGVVLHLREPLRVRGTITMPKIAAPNAATMDGKQMAGGPQVTISLAPDESEGGGIRTGGGGQARVTASGPFEMRSLRPGVYRLAVYLQNPEWYVSDATLAGQNLLQGPATVESGTGEVPLQITVREGGGVIRGRLEPKPDSGQQACFLRLYSVEDRSGSSPNLRQVYCQQDGRFQIPGVAPGRHKLFVFTMEEMQEGDMEALTVDRWESAPTVAMGRGETVEVEPAWP